MRKQTEFIQTEDLTIWEVPFKQGQSEGRAIAAFDQDGNSLDWERAWFENGVLRVDFGIDKHTGKLIYDFTVEGEKEQDTSVGNDININGGTINGPIINTYHGGQIGTPTKFQ